VIQIRELHRADKSDFGRELDGVEGIHCLEGTRAENFHPLTQPIETDYIIGKRRYSAFLGTDLDLLLRCLSVKNLFLIGGFTDICVRFTAVDAHQHDYWFYVVSDSVVGSGRKAHDYALLNMKYLQRESNITTADVLSAQVL
jgi:nicotinamidase-related amidase